jgi:chitin disaccharide deacetylase
MRGSTGSEREGRDPRGLLIVNADDWGANAATSNAIYECWAAGAVTSISGMVFMADSERAAQLAIERGLPVGLHINLTESFTASAVPPSVTDRQARLVRYFEGPKWHRWGFSARLFTEIERSVGDQLREFRRIYGREPSHFDGHEHIHQSLSVLGARTLPSGSKMRPTFTFGAGEKSPVNRWLRALLQRAMMLRFVTPSYFFSIRDLHPAFGGVGLEEKLALANGSSVEIMTHPGLDEERPVLLSDSWRELIGLRRLGGYSDL